MSAKIKSPSSAMPRRLPETPPGTPPAQQCSLSRSLAAYSSVYGCLLGCCLLAYCCGCLRARWPGKNNAYPLRIPRPILSVYLLLTPTQGPRPLHCERFPFANIPPITVLSFEVLPFGIPPSRSCSEKPL